VTVDIIRPTPSTDVVPFPNRSDDISNALFTHSGQTNTFDTNIADEDMQSRTTSYQKK
jgi:hypothetical protein